MRIVKWAGEWRWHPGQPPDCRRASLGVRSSAPHPLDGIPARKLIWASLRSRLAVVALWTGTIFRFSPIFLPTFSGARELS